MTNKDKCRAAFEEWARRISFCLPLGYYSGRHGSKYTNNETEFAFEGYQAAYNAQQEIIDHQAREHELLERLYKNAREFAESEARKCHELYTALAPLLGLKPYYGTCNKQQTIWAESQEQANSLGAGGNIYKFVDEAMKLHQEANQCQQPS